MDLEFSITATLVNGELDDSSRVIDLSVSHESKVHHNISPNDVLNLKSYGRKYKIEFQPGGSQTARLVSETADTLLYLAQRDMFPLKVEMKYNP